MFIYGLRSGYNHRLWFYKERLDEDENACESGLILSAIQPMDVCYTSLDGYHHYIILGPFIP